MLKKVTEGCCKVGGRTLLVGRKMPDDWEKGACKQGERRGLTGSLLGCYKFLAGAKRYFSGR